MTVGCLSLLLLAPTTTAQLTPPMPNPKVPTPYWPTEKIPIALHAANETGMYSEDAIAQLAKYDMVTIEKWYTLCGAKHPQQGTPDCNVEAKFYETFNKIAELNPKGTNIIYLNSMFDFAAYNLHGEMMKLEAAGKPAFLRDDKGDVVILCNDGNFYCNITTFDHTKPYVRELWLKTLLNATKLGSVGGVFADHGWGTNIGQANADGTSTLCNGGGALRSCWNFSASFSAEFNEAHRWVLNTSQNMLASLPKRGPTVNGPYSQWGRRAGDPCDFEMMREVAMKPVEHAVVECSAGGCEIDPELQGGGGVSSCMAAFMMWMRPGMFMSCVDPRESRWGGLPPFYDEWNKKLGPATGPAKESSAGVWVRTFQHADLAKPTTVTYRTATKTGSIDWADGPAGPPKIWPGNPNPPAPPTPPAPPAPPAPASCGKVMVNTGVANFDLGVHAATSIDECCSLCQKHGGCAVWAWHAELHGKPCHLHSKKGEINHHAGCYAGVLL